MKKFFKVLSIFGLLAASVIFAFVIYGIKSIPDSIHLVSDEKLKFIGYQAVTFRFPLIPKMRQRALCLVNTLWIFPL